MIAHLKKEAKRLGIKVPELVRRIVDQHREGEVDLFNTAGIGGKKIPRALAEQALPGYFKGKKT